MIVDAPAVNWPVNEVLFPVVTFPKLRVTGLAFNWFAAKPNPDNGSVTPSFGALLATVSEPALTPPEDGANVTLIVKDWPGVRVAGNAGGDDKLKSAPATDTCDISIFVLLEALFERTNGILWRVPTVTEPKSMANGA